jgi:DNA-binding FadR family transcriptional regulator
MKSDLTARDQIHLSGTLISLQEVTMTGADSSRTLPWKPLARMRTHEKVMAEIEHRLRAGSLRAGDRLPPERLFAEALGVSRGAVREALRILEALGVIEAGTGSGPSSGSVIVKDGTSGMALLMRLHMHVASFSAANLGEVRIFIEKAAAMKAAEAATATDIAELKALVDQMRDALTAAATHELIAAFHTRVVRISDNALAAVLVEAFAEAQSFSAEPLFDADCFERHTQAVAEEYAAIANAISAGNGTGAAELLATSFVRSQPTGPGNLKWAG